MADPGARPSLTFLGAVGTVTGSRFLVESGARRVLVDAGLYQGMRELRRRNWEPFPVDPATLDAVVLTHAHLDHTGYLPRLVHDGFWGPVVCTRATADLTAIVLRDSAHLQEEDAAYANAVGYSRHDPALPLYARDDVEKTLPMLAPCAYDEDVEVCTGITVRLQTAGHILGSASIVLDAGGGRTVFSGDLGRPHHPLLLPPPPRPVTDVVVVESTYGDRTHGEADPGRLAAAVRRTLERGGSVLIPAFAVDRTELVLMEIRRLMMSGEVPHVPVHVDSPMALSALEVYRRALADPAPARVRPEAAGGPDPFDPGDLHRVRTAQESQKLNRPERPCIVISASGMASGGRVLHHLAHQLPDRRNSVVLTGFQAEGTRGRALLAGAREVKIHGRYVPVRAEIVDVADFSVHADAGEVLSWLRSCPVPPTNTFVVHGEPGAARALADRVRDEQGWCVAVPAYRERVRVG